MVPCTYRDNGIIRTFDVRTAVRIVRGASALHAGWSAAIVYDPASKTLIELSSGPQDIRGNAPSAAERVDMAYVVGNFGVSEQEVLRLASRHT